jgi:phosphoribosylaminoimidazolecarboxamide formyltransferase/IMP cyclohydrolase
MAKSKKKSKKVVAKKVAKKVAAARPKKLNGGKAKKIAFLSVYNKTGLVKFAKGLKKLGFEIVSTGGTAEELRKNRIRVAEVQELTKYPSILGGRVKSLHPIIHGGILADPNNPNHYVDLQKYKIRPFEMVVCNLYPFAEVISRPHFTHEEAIEMIDIGGPAMVRAAAKNHKNVVVIVNPNDYKEVLRLYKVKGGVDQETREELALKAFRHTKFYDMTISHYFSGKIEGQDYFPGEADLAFEKIQDLRYGENPHQKGAFYREKRFTKRDMGVGITEARQIQGKVLSFNNIVDADSAWQLCNYFVDPTVVVVKHNNPCGVGTDKVLSVAYKKAFDCDPVSAYGGVIAMNREVCVKTANELSGLFVEVLIAPSYEKKALAILAKKKNLRMLEMGPNAVRKPYQGVDIKRISGGMLLQDPDNAQLAISDIKVVTNNQPTLGEMEDLFFAWGVCKHTKSNAIILAKNGQTIGVGAGQMSRIDSTEIAIKKASGKTKDSVLASDAFFPFRDVIDVAAKAGISAIIQPGGSIRDQESIDAANEHGIAMVFTGRRHFRH